MIALPPEVIARSRAGLACLQHHPHGGGVWVMPSVFRFDPQKRIFISAVGDKLTPRHISMATLSSTSKCWAGACTNASYDTANFPRDIEWQLPVIHQLSVRPRARQTGSGSIENWIANLVGESVDDTYPKLSASDREALAHFIELWSGETVNRQNFEQMCNRAIRGRSEWWEAGRSNRYSPASPQLEEYCAARDVRSPHHAFVLYALNAVRGEPLPRWIEVKNYAVPPT